MFLKRSPVLLKRMLTQRRLGKPPCFQPGGGQTQLGAGDAAGASAAIAAAPGTTEAAASPAAPSSTRRRSSILTSLGPIDALGIIRRAGSRQNGDGTPGFLQVPEMFAAHRVAGSGEPAGAASECGAAAGSVPMLGLGGAFGATTPGKAGNCSVQGRVGNGQP